MTTPLNMLEYLEYAGIDIKPLVNETAIEKEYFRQIYRVDSREKVLRTKEKGVKKPANRSFSINLPNSQH